MRYHALACDYDGTLAHHGRVAEETLVALERLLATGRKLILVTGRRLEDLLEVFPEIGQFHRVVAENGGLLYDPSVREEKILADAPPDLFAQTLRERGVNDLATGHVIVATGQPHETVVIGTIRDLGLELQVIFNKGAVMVLPAGVNKASGLAAALESLHLSPHEVVGVGDAENDFAFLNLCECSVAVANALPSLAEQVDWVTRGGHGDGVCELIKELILNDIEPREAAWTRRHLLLGARADGTAVRFSPRGPNILIAGPSGSGKSTSATSILERLIERQYQFCIVDPEGDYEGLEGAITLGRSGRVPVVEEILDVLAKPTQSVVVNLIGLPLTNRPSFFVELLPRLQEMRARTGRPHWLVVDETHHLMPTLWEPVALVSPQDLQRALFITVHPDEISPFILRSVGTVIAVGKSPDQTLRGFCKPLQIRLPRLEATELKSGEVLFWPMTEQQQAYRVRVEPSRTERSRHTRKYAVGELPPERCFYFRGPEGKLNLRAQNLVIFLQMAEGLDEETWLHHLRQGDYARWFRDGIKDEELAAGAEEIQREEGISAEESRKQIRETVQRRYTLPAVPSPPVAEPTSAARPTDEAA